MTNQVEYGFANDNWLLRGDVGEIEAPTRGGSSMVRPRTSEGKAKQACESSRRIPPGG